MRRTLVLLTAVLLALSLAAPAAVMAAPGHTYLVPKPTGNDTANIQQALDYCAAHGPNCTVQLQAGTYKTSQLVTYNFRGTFEGAGQNRTTIAALPNLTVSWMGYGNSSACAPNTAACLWPMLIIFVNGTIEVSDLTISEPSTGAAEVTMNPETWPYTFLYDLLAFTGQSRTNASVDRVSIKGVADSSTTSFDYGDPTNYAGGLGGWNLINGIDYSGFYPNGSMVYPLTGSFSVRDSMISWEYNPLALDGPHASDQVTIGGAPRAGNTLSNAGGDIDLESAQRSTFDISYNTIAATNTGMWVSWDPGSPTSPSQYLIHNNLFEPQWGCGCAGVELYDNPVTHYIQAKIYNNTFNVAQDNDGIDIVATKGVMIAGNTMTAAGLGGYDGIGLYGATHTSVIANNVSGFGIDTGGGGAAQIYLAPANPAWIYRGFFPMPAATDNLVVCLRHSDQVLDQGTDNTVIGCDPTTATSKVAAVGTASVTGRLGLKAKTFLP